MIRSGSRGVSLVACLLAGVSVALLAFVILFDHRVLSADSPVVGAPVDPVDGEASRSQSSSAQASQGFRYPTTIRAPSGPPVIELTSEDPQGRLGSVACSTCHSVREANFETRTPAELDQFHQNMPFSHGSITCYSCHHPTDADALRLANGTSVAYPDVMTLCAQCHGPQARDFEHGAHGGMNGYWDLSRGPRTRNNCIDCHDPHAPQFPRMQPTFKPRDRFLKASSTDEAHGE